MGYISLLKVTAGYIFALKFTPPCPDGDPGLRCKDIIDRVLETLKHNRGDHYVSKRFLDGRYRHASFDPTEISLEYMILTGKLGIVYIRWGKFLS